MTAKNTLGTSTNLYAENSAKRQEAKPRILAEYGRVELTDEEIYKVLGVATELNVCKACTGQCLKAEPYSRPKVSVVNGTLQISSKPCEYAQQSRFKAEATLAQIPAKYAKKTFADYETTPENAQVVKKAKWIARDYPPQSLYLYGACGTGKTFLAALIGQEYLRGLRAVIFGDVPTLLDEIKRTFDGKGDAQAIIDRYGDCDLLILDDLGTGQITEWSVGILYQIVNRRYNAGKPLIVTSNYDLRGLSERLIVKDKQGNVIESMTGRRIVSRLSEMCIQAFLGTNDRRRKS